MSVRTGLALRTKDLKALKVRALRGFTLVEVMVVTVISSFVFAGVLSAYIFLGRGLTRQGHEEELESSSRTTLYDFTQDVSGASAISTGFTTNAFSISTSPAGTVTYTYYPQAAVQGIEQGYLTRQQNGNAPTTILKNISGFGFNYYDITGNPLVPNSNPTTVKEIQFAYRAKGGSSISGAQSVINVVSPRVIMKNKAGTMP
jgi:prepilin-type N-terminal cleavage/methylation domain-containing protein